MKDYQFWFTVLSLQALLAFGLYTTWTTYKGIHEDTLARAMRETTRLKAESVPLGEARSVIDQQFLQMENVRSNQADLLRWTSWWFYLSIATLALEVITLLGKMIVARREPHARV